MMTTVQIPIEDREDESYPQLTRVTQYGVLLHDGTPLWANIVADSRLNLDANAVRLNGFRKSTEHQTGVDAHAFRVNYNAELLRARSWYREQMEAAHIRPGGETGEVLTFVTREVTIIVDQQKIVPE